MPKGNRGRSRFENIGLPKPYKSLNDGDSDLLISGFSCFMANSKKSFRDFYHLTFVDLYKLKMDSGMYNDYTAQHQARKEVRMYAQLFSRDIRRLFLKNSSCAICGSIENLEIDHKIPLVLGGKNVVENVQVLCFKCHKNKTATEGKYKFSDLLKAMKNED